MNPLMITAGLVSFGCALSVAPIALGRSLPKLTVSSAAFAEGAPIPVKYTCQGDDISPPLQWAGAPAATKSFALICDDPDAPVGTWVHWVLYNLPPTAAALSEKTPKSKVLANGAAQGLNSSGQTGYQGPCPPGGKAHRYFFKLYALDATVSLEGRVTKEELLKAMEGHILGIGQIMGTYQRQ
ncbi:MAG: YbhB/YbcL family Raf kinase inhibitor-like protein [Verrucomicrobiota bacterium]|jgi:Raf kinase inhibitor-like YbhB/YbcL family protein